MQPMMPEPPVGRMSLILGIVLRYKICCYVHPTVAEKQLFLKLMCEHLALIRKILTGKKTVIASKLYGMVIMQREMKMESFTRYVL
jgi:hypothetical protein